MNVPDQSTPASVDPYQTLGNPAPTSARGRGRFQVLRPHARGNLGEVFVAHDAELHREVALKEIQPARADDPENRRRFLVEAEVTGGLEHPGIVPVYSLGAHPDGRPYYAMRFIRGRSLLEAIDDLHEAARTGSLGAEDWSLQLRKLLRSIIVVCQAMDYAHSRGVVHRDLKPHNIMIGHHGETIVVDWGLARIVGANETGGGSAAESWLHVATEQSSDLTMAGSLVGTPAYMSPEQAAGRTDLVGPASDIYSLGCTLYHLLAGRPAFRGDSLEEVLKNVKSGTYPPARSVRPLEPRGLEAIAAKAMATAPGERYATAVALADDIEHWLADQPFAAYRERPVERVFRWLRRHRAWAVAGFCAASATALIALAAVRIVDGQRRVASRLANEKTALADAERLAREQTVTGIRRARAGELAANSRAIKQTRPELSVLLAVEAIRATTRHGLPIVPAAEESLREAISEIGGVPFHQPEPVLALSGCGRWLVGPTMFFDMDALEPAASGIAHGVQAVRACASADDSRLALLAADGTVTVVDPNDLVRRPVVIPSQGGPFVPDDVVLRLSPDGRWLFIATDSTARLHDLGAAATAPVLVPGRAATAVFSPDSRHVALQSGDPDGAATPSEGRTVDVWRLDDLAGGPAAIVGDIDHRPLAFSPSGGELVTRDGSGDSRVRIWTLAEPDVATEITTVPGEATAIYPESDDRVVLTEHKSQLKGWRILVRRPAGHWHQEHSVEIESPEDSFAVACSRTWLVASFNKAEIPVWNLPERFEGGQGGDPPDCILHGHRRRATALAFSRDGRRLVSVDRSATQVWDFTVPHPEVVNQTLAPRPGSLLARPDAPAGGATGDRVMSPDGHWLAIDGEDEIVRVLDLTGDDPMRYPIELVGHQGKAVFHAFSPDSRWLATGGADHTVCVWDLAQLPRGGLTSRRIATPAVRFSTEGLDPAFLRFGAESGQLWAAGRTASSGAMVLWEWSPSQPETATRRAQVTDIRVNPRLAVSLTADALTVGLQDGRAERYRLARGVPVGSPEPLAEGMAAIMPTSDWTRGDGTGPRARSLDGRWRTDVDENGDIELVEIGADGAETITRLRHDRDATFQCAAFSGDSELLATGFSDGGLQVWNLRDEDIVRSRMVLRGHVNPVQYIEFDRSDRWLVSSSSTAVRLWEMDVSKLIAMAQRAIGRSLTDDERARFGIEKPRPSELEEATAGVE